MNKTVIICTFLIINLFISNALSQDDKVTIKPSPSELKTRTVRRGDKSAEIRPSENSEYIKYRIEIAKDSAFYSLKADKFEKGVFISEGVIEEIDLKRKVYKGDKILFEMTPDISKSSQMTLFIYFPGMTRFRFLDCAENKHIKYRKFKETDPSKSNKVPIMICYVDDKYNNTDKLLEKYTKENLITLTSDKEIKEKILANIEKCIFVYYNLTAE